MQGITANGRSKKAGAKNGPLGLHNSFLQKIPTRAISLLSPAAKMLRTSQFPIGCMRWQHTVIL